MPSALVPLAQGCEELEAITIIDLLRRADIDVVTAGLDGEPVVSAHNVTITPDASLDDALGRDFDMVVLPGGLPGADNLNADERVRKLVKDMHDGGKIVAAICAAPIVLANSGILSGKRATSYPGFLDKMDLPDVTCTGAAVERDGQVITSRGPGTAIDFGLELIDALLGTEKRDEIEGQLVR